MSGNFFDVLGVRPVTGRFFRTEEQEDAPGKHPVAVISERFWQRHFHADPEIIGKVVRLNGRELTVIGVAPAEFLGTDRRSFIRLLAAAFDGVVAERRRKRA